MFHCYGFTALSVLMVSFVGTFLELDAVFSATVKCKDWTVNMWKSSQRKNIFLEKARRKISNDHFKNDKKSWLTGKKTYSNCGVVLKTFTLLTLKQPNYFSYFIGVTNDSIGYILM